MFCTTCGAQLPDGARFCSKCGAPVAPAPKPAPEPPAPTPEPAAEQPAPAPAAPEPEPAAEAPAPKPTTAAAPAPDAPKPPEAASEPVPATPPSPASPDAPRPPEGMEPTAAPSPAAPSPAPATPPAPNAAEKPAAPAATVPADTFVPTPVPPKKSKKHLVIGIVVAIVVGVLAYGAVQMLMGGGAWKGSMMLEGTGSSALFDQEFGIVYDGTTMTVYDQDEKVSGKVASSHEEDGEVYYELTDISWGSWGTELFQSNTVHNKQLTVMVPKGARVVRPYGRWGMIVTATDVADDDYPLFVRSTVLELTDDASGSYEFAAEWGKTQSDIGIADPTSPYYNPGESGWDRRISANGSHGSYRVSILDDTYTLTFK